MVGPKFKNKVGVKFVGQISYLATFNGASLGTYFGVKSLTSAIPSCTILLLTKSRYFSNSVPEIPPTQKGLQTCPFKSPWLPNANINLTLDTYVTYSISPKVSKRVLVFGNSLYILAKDWLKNTFTTHH